MMANPLISNELCAERSSAERASPGGAPNAMILRRLLPIDRTVPGASGPSGDGFLNHPAETPLEPLTGEAPQR